MTDDSVAGRLEPFEWNQAEAVGYEVALEVINEAVACYSALIARARAAGDEPEAQRLSGERSRCVERRNGLDSTDHDAVARITREQADLVRRLRDRLG
ncbi:hypothetical protein [Dactylosporangium sp. CA-092794]|uniref:hypothetical protein n=1 Tax=Dactylosporangium sp. CA-092794 TaxID=3239929 RepID=UPI003D92CCA7